MAGFLSVGGVRQQEPDAVLVGDGADTGQIGRTAIDRSEVQLEIARVKDHTLRSVKRGREAVGHRVGDGNELNIERPDAPALAIVHRKHLGPAQQSFLFDPVASQPECER